MCACEQKTEMNPFFTEFQTEYGAPDFTKIRLEHYEPAFLKGIEEQNAEIKAIVDNPEESTFENTIVALDKSGAKPFNRMHLQAHVVLEYENLSHHL